MEKKKKSVDDIINESIEKRKKKAPIIEPTPILEIWGCEYITYNGKKYSMTDIKDTHIIDNVFIIDIIGEASLRITTDEMLFDDMIEMQKLLQQHINPYIPHKVIEEKPSMYDFISSGADHRAVIFLKEMLKSRKTRMSPEEALELEQHYNNTFGLNEKIAGCDICAVRMWKRLINHFHIK